MCPPIRRSIIALGTMAALIAAGCRSREAMLEDEPFDLTFKGNEKISTETLLEHVEEGITRLREAGFRKSDVDDISFEIERFYRMSGYHFARVDYQYTPDQATFEIQEGFLVVIREIRFEGNRAFSRDRLLELLTAERTGLFGLGEMVFVESEVDQLQGAVEDLYLEQGYQEVRVEEPSVEFTPDRREAVVTVVIHEGPQYVFDHIDFVELPLLDPKEVAAAFDYLVGSAYVPRIRFEVRSGIEDIYADRGHPDPRVEVNTELLPPVADEVRVAVRVRAVPGPVVRIREVRIIGNEETEESYIRSRVLLKGGETYNGSLARQSFRRLFRTGLFKSVDLQLTEPASPPEEARPEEEEAPPEAPGEETPGVEVRDLIVEVVEGPSLEYFFEVGFGSYDLARGRVGVREKNFLGRGLIGRAELLGSVRGGQATVGITDPWFLQTDWTADLPVTALYREEPSFTLLEGSLRLRLSRPLTRRLSGGAAYRFSLSRIEDFAIEDIAREEPDLRLGAAGPFLEFDSRDDLLVPTGGTKARVFGEVGTPYLGGEISFLHGGVTLSHYLQIFEGTVLAAMGQTDWIVPINGTDLIPIQERLFNGGESLVRSFRQSELGPKDVNGEPLGGEVMNIVSLELRQRVIGNFSIGIFGDYGNVALTDAKPFDDFRPAVGFGVRYGLPIGPVRLDVGFNPDQREDEDLYVIHFAVGMPY